MISLSSSSMSYSYLKSSKYRKFEKEKEEGRCSIVPVVIQVTPPKIIVQTVFDDTQKRANMVHVNANIAAMKLCTSIIINFDTKLANIPVLFLKRFADEILTLQSKEDRCGITALNPTISKGSSLFICSNDSRSTTPIISSIGLCSICKFRNDISYLDCIEYAVTKYSTSAPEGFNFQVTLELMNTTVQSRSFIS